MDYSTALDSIVATHSLSCAKEIIEGNKNPIQQIIINYFPGVCFSFLFQVSIC